MGAFQERFAAQAAGRPRTGRWVQGPETPGQFQQHGPSAMGAAPTGDPYAGMRGMTPGGGLAQAPMGWDFTGPGVAEQFFQGQQQRWAQPGMATQFAQQATPQLGAPGQGAQYWNQVQGRFNQPTAAEGAYQGFQGSTPADLAPFYEHAKRRTGADLNTALAAKGAFGSSAGGQMIGDAVSNLEAQRAQQEAQYGLQRAGLAGQLAQGADVQRLGQLGLGGRLAGAAGSEDLRRTALAGQLAQGADAADLARLASGMGAAGAAQQARRARGRDYMSDVFNPAQMAMAQNQAQMNQMIADDQALMDAVIAMEMGMGREGLAQDRYQAAQHRADVGMIMDMISKLKGMGGGM